jgi:hypothetical protein
MERGVRGRMDRREEVSEAGRTGERRSQRQDGERRSQRQDGQVTNRHMVDKTKQ